MKLIKELVEEVQVITEASENGKKNYYIEGVFLQSDIANRNKRLYPKHIMEREVQRYIKEHIETKRAMGELGHPDGPNINLDRASHMIVSLKEDGNNYIGRAKIMDTPMGRIAKTLLDEGVKLGVSSRGLGSLKPNRDGINEVQSDFFLATAADIVADPSAPDAFVQGIMENKDWMLVNGKWESREMEESKKLLENAHRKQIEEIGMNIFKDFLYKIASKE